MKRGFSAAEAADYLGVSERELRRLTANGHLAPKYAGEKHTKPLYDLRDLDRHFDSLPTERTA